MTGRDVRMLWTLDGPYATARYSYRLTAPVLKFDDTGFVDVKADGSGRLTPWPLRVPLRLTARAITGVGDVAGAILANARLDGMLTITPKFVRGEGLQLRSAKLNAKLGLLIDLVSGRFQVVISGGLTRYFIDGLGIVDVQSELTVVPGPGGKGSRIVGTGKAWVRRLDNSFFASLTGGLPRIETRLERGPDGILRFSGMQFYSPKLRLTGEGHRNRDGTFHIVARGRQATYGPVRLVLDGRIERPRVQLFLERPNDTLGIRDMQLLLSPTAAGFDYRANGQSMLGPFTSNGRILLPRGGRATIAIAALDVSGTRASGDLRADPGGFTGLLNLSGGGLDGTLAFAPVGDAQKIEAHLRASNARFPTLSVRSGRLDGNIILAEGRTTLDGSVDARGLEISGISLARLTANAKLVNGEGQVRALLAGRRGAAFEFSTLANIAPDRIQLTGQGSVERRALGPQPGRRSHALGRRVGACADQHLFCGRARSAFRPERLAARSPRAASVHAARSPRPRLAEPRPHRRCERAPRLCVEGQSQRPRRSQDPRPQPCRVWFSRRSRSTSGFPQSSRATRRQCAPWRSAAARRSDGRRRGSLRSGMAS